jgi:hypothetical protein
VKDQYFGDINDYRKYGLLRAILSGSTVRLGVCWMLTAPDSRTDGRHLAYLDKPTRFRGFDTELFDWLQQTMYRYPDRRTSRIEAAHLLDRTEYFADLLTDGHAHRKEWFDNCRRKLRECDLVFLIRIMGWSVLSPSDGLTPTSSSIGRRSVKPSRQERQYSSISIFHARHARLTLRRWRNDCGSKRARQESSRSSRLMCFFCWPLTLGMRRPFAR